MSVASGAKRACSTVAPSTSPARNAVTISRTSGPAYSAIARMAPDAPAANAGTTVAPLPVSTRKVGPCDSRYCVNTGMLPALSFMPITFSCCAISCTNAGLNTKCA